MSLFLLESVGVLQKTFFFVVNLSSMTSSGFNTFCVFGTVTMKFTAEKQLIVTLPSLKVVFQWAVTSWQRIFMRECPEGLLNVLKRSRDSHPPEACSFVFLLKLSQTVKAPHTHLVINYNCVFTSARELS